MPQFSTSVVKKIIRKLGRADLRLQAKDGGIIFDGCQIRFAI
jgi:hypothetical protein